MDENSISEKDQSILSQIHTNLHNDNDLFYTLSPHLLIAITKAFNIQHSNGLLDGYGYYEFGLFKGFSFWFAEQISHQYIDSNFSLYGFDSFEGLPESKVDKHRYWKEGNYASSWKFVTQVLKNHGVDPSGGNVNLFKGFFQKEYFLSLHRNNDFTPISILVIDTDIYESCVEVLDFIKDKLVPDSIILFDDYNAFNRDDNHGERKAMREFQLSYPYFKKEHLFDFGLYGVAFKVLNGVA